MQNIGDRLEEARKRKGVSIREAAEATKIRSDYLQKFEANQFDFDLAEIYVRGFLRNYAAFLKLPADRIVADYNALGGGAARPKTPSREVYGRMDLTIASADDREERAEAVQAAVAEQPGRAAPALPRGTGSLPKAPAVDPALVFKGGIALVVVLALLFVVWLAKSLFAPASPAERATAAPPPAAVAGPTMTLIALDTVRVGVTEAATGQVLLPETTIERGQRLVVARPGTVIVQADNGANVQIEVNGRRYAMPPNSNLVQLQ